MKTLKEFILEAKAKANQFNFDDIPFEKENVSFSEANNIVKDFGNGKLTQNQLNQLFDNFDKTTLFKYGTSAMCTGDIHEYCVENDLFEGEVSIHLGEENSEFEEQIDYYNINNNKFIMGTSLVGDDYSFVLVAQ